MYSERSSIDSELGVEQLGGRNLDGRPVGLVYLEAQGRVGRRHLRTRRLEEGNPERAGDGEHDRGGADRDAAHRERRSQAFEVHHDASSDSGAALGAIHHAAIERKKSTAAPVATRFRNTICTVEVEKNAVKLTLVSMSA